MFYLFFRPENLLLGGDQTVIIVVGSTRIVTKENYSPELYTELCEKYKVTISMLAPRQVASLIKLNPNASSFQSLRMLSLGGELMKHSQMQKLQELMPNAVLNLSYGMSEASVITFKFGLHKENSVGSLVPNIELRIIDDNGNNLGSNEVGEILVKNNMNWNGYYGNPLETVRIKDSLGWVHTGDIGYMDQDHYLYVTGRKKDILKYHGIH